MMGGVKRYGTDQGELQVSTVMCIIEIVVADDAATGYVLFRVRYLGYSFLPPWEQITNSKKYIAGCSVVSHDDFDDAHYCGDL